MEKIQWELWIIMKNGHREGDTLGKVTHFTLLLGCKTENFKRVIFVMKVLP